MIATPMQTVKARFETKAKLVDKLSGQLERKGGEDKDALKKRLLQTSCKKLLRLARRVETGKKKKT